MTMQKQARVYRGKVGEVEYVLVCGDSTHPWRLKLPVELGAQLQKSLNGSTRADIRRVAEVRRALERFLPPGPGRDIPRPAPALKAYLAHALHASSASLPAGYFA
ncbi:MAG: hypothetical protein HY329_01080 [Chloroflexi bacterium]|nr:hypothetical protein [Chloroflexota bacterium]